MDAEAVERRAREIATAICRRDRATLESALSPDFVHRTPGGPTTTSQEFLDAIANIPGEILSVTLEDVSVDVVGDAALATGVQQAQVRVDGQIVEDRRVFADWFVREGNTWRLRVAVELPPEPTPVS